VRPDELPANPKVGTIVMPTVPKICRRRATRRIPGQLHAAPVRLLAGAPDRNGPSIAHIAIECIGNSDALYHNVEHTMLVTLVGHDIVDARCTLTCRPKTMRM